MAGTLYVCATPIGNLEDITLRVLRILKEADLIAAEDTRHTRGLLEHFDIHTPLTSYHEHNKEEKGPWLADQLAEGKNIALVSDAGMPAISDPGEPLVALCRTRGIPVTVLPGPCALVTALAGSGFPGRQFCFEGFLPADKKERRERLAALTEETRTMILYEAPHRIKKTLAELAEALGGDRPMMVCRELTKQYETYQPETIDSFIAFCEKEEPRGEFVLVIRGRDVKEIEEQRQADWQKMSVADHVQMYLDEGMTEKDAMKQAARDRGVQRREIYRQLKIEEQ